MKNPSVSRIILERIREGDGYADKSIREILTDYLEIGDYDGLYLESEDCGCEVDDLCPCNNDPHPQCRAGYKHEGESGVWRDPEEEKS